MLGAMRNALSPALNMLVQHHSLDHSGMSGKLPRAFSDWPNWPDGLGGGGARSGPDVWGNPLYHEYICVNQGGVVTCGGLDRAKGPWGPVKPSDDSMNASRASCKKVAPDNNCFENCLRNAFKNCSLCMLKDDLEIKFDLTWRS